MLHDYYSSTYYEENELLKPNSPLETRFTEKLALTSSPYNLDEHGATAHCKNMHRVKSNFKLMNKADSFDSADYSRYNEDNYHSKKGNIYLSPTNNHVPLHQSHSDGDKVEV